MNLVGTSLGPFQIEAEIGSGGMARVYRATQSSLNRKVAIKELRQDFSNDRAQLVRFEQEAKFVAALTHQNIIHVYDFIDRDAAKYIVMEYVEGVDLDTLLSRVRRIPPDVAAVIGLQVACALEHAHMRGVIHRDLKPSNLMVSGHGEVKLMDFGIARHGGSEQESLTLPGIALGTPAYMSPEQIMGERVDFRSDIFSFGIVLYHMLAGQKPFPHSDARSVMHQTLSDAYAGLSSIYPDIPYALRKIVACCLHKDPHNRYAHTENLRHDLERFVAARVSLNYPSRLVSYLQHLEDGMLNSKSRAPHTTYLQSIDSGAVNSFHAVLRPVLGAHVCGLFLLIMWTVLAVHDETGVVAWRLFTAHHHPPSHSGHGRK